MKIDDEIKYIDQKLLRIQKEVKKLSSKKENLLSIKETFSDCEYERGCFASKSLNDEVSCMRLSYDYGTITAKFHINPKKYGRPIHSSPLLNKIATISYKHRINNFREIEIHDYEKMISDNCKRKKKFLKRIKVYLIKKIQSEKLTVSDKSFNKDFFKKLLLLS